MINVVAVVVTALLLLGTTVRSDAENNVAQDTFAVPRGGRLVGNVSAPIQSALSESGWELSLPAGTPKAASAQRPLAEQWNISLAIEPNTANRTSTFTARVTSTRLDRFHVVLTGVRQSVTLFTELLISPRDLPLDAAQVTLTLTAPVGVVDGGHGVLLWCALFVEPAHVTPVVARVDLPQVPVFGTFQVVLRNSSFGVSFDLELTPSTKPTKIRYHPVLAWTVRRLPAEGHVRVPALTIGVFAGDSDAPLKTAAVNHPSPQGVTFQDVLHSTDVIQPLLPPTASQALAGHLQRHNNNETEDSAADVESLLLTVPPELHRVVNRASTIHLVAEYREFYREHFGEVTLRDVADGLIDALRETRAGAQTIDFAVALTPRLRLPGVAHAEDPAVTVGFSRSEAPQQHTLLEHQQSDHDLDHSGWLTVAVSASVPIADVQLIVLTTDGAVVTAVEAGELVSSEHNSVVFTDCVAVPRHGWPDDSLRVVVRFNERQQAAPRRAAITSVGRSPDDEHSHDALLEPAYAAVVALEVAGGVVAAAVAPRRLRWAGGDEEWVFRTTTAVTAGTVLLSMPTAACLTVDAVLAQVPVLQQIVTSDQWITGVLRPMGLPDHDSPHNDAFILALGLLWGMAPAAIDAAFKASRHARFPTTWAEGERRVLFGDRHDAITAVGAEVEAAVALWSAQQAFLKFATDAAIPVDDFRRAAAFVGASMKRIGGRVVLQPLASAFPHDDDPTAVEAEAKGSSDDDAVSLRVSRQALAVGAPITLDYSDGGRVSVAEAFAQFGVVTAGNPASAVAIVRGVALRLSKRSRSKLLAILAGEATPALTATLLNRLNEAVSASLTAVRAHLATLRDATAVAAVSPHRVRLALQVVEAEEAVLVRQLQYAGEELRALRTAIGGKNDAAPTLEGDDEM